MGAFFRCAIINDSFECDADAKIFQLYIDCKNFGQPQKLGLFANADKNKFYVQNKYATQINQEISERI